MALDLLYAAHVTFSGAVVEQTFESVVPKRSAMPIVTSSRNRVYLPVPAKFALALGFACAWTLFSIWVSPPWLHQLGLTLGMPLALFVVTFIAYVPGFMNAFLGATTVLDRRPIAGPIAHWPGATILIACYNEAGNITDTLTSIVRQRYPGELRVIVLDDGSRDGSADIARAAIAGFADSPIRFEVVAFPCNRGKSHVLNDGLAMCEHELVISADADCWFRCDAMQRLVARYLCDPAHTRAVAGAVMVRNSRRNWITRVQEWDYFLGIAAVKRMQSMYHGILVAQGAFSLYSRTVLREIGGWPHCVGEDIVVTWAILNRGWRIGYAEDAMVFTCVPETMRAFAHQRKRWSRGLVEAFANHGRLLLQPRMSTLFIWWNLLFLPMDLVFTFAFIPGIVLALFGWYGIAGVMTLTVLPLALLWNLAILYKQRQVFMRCELRIRRNILGFLLFVLGYTMVLQPVCVWGYVSELLGARKHWGTK